MDKAIDKRRWHFTIVDNAVLYSSQLSEHEKLIYTILCSFANAKTNECYPSIKTLSEYARISQNTVRSAIKGLKEKGLIDVKERKIDGNNLSNLYEILELPDWIIEETKNKIETTSTAEGVLQQLKGGTSNGEGGVLQMVKGGTSTVEDEQEQYNYNNNNYNKLTINSSCSSNSTDMGEIYKYYEQAGFGVINGKVAEFLDAMVEVYSKEWVIKAIDQAVKNAKYNLKYVEGILQNWKRNGGIQENKPKAEVKSSKKVVNHPYINYSGQRQYDVSELEKNLLGKGELSNG